MQRSRAEIELDELDRVFKALAHPSRRHILIVMNARGGKMTAGDIAGRFACSWPTTTRHLRVLENAGLVDVVSQGRERVYVLRKDRLIGTGRGWFDWFD